MTYDRIQIRHAAMAGMIVLLTIAYLSHGLTGM